MSQYTKPKPIQGLTVLVVNDNVEKALRKFKKKVNESGLLQDLRAREFYEKPTTERKRKKGAAKARLRKRVAADSMPKKLY